VIPYERWVSEVLEASQKDVRIDKFWENGALGPIYDLGCVICRSDKSDVEIASDDFATGRNLKMVPIKEDKRC